MSMRIKLLATSDENKTPDRAESSTPMKSHGDEAMLGTSNHQSMRREIEKRMIKEDILSSWLRRKEVEEEVMRELISDNDIATLRGKNLLLGTEIQSALPLTLNGHEQRPANRAEAAVTDERPFQREPRATNETGVKPLIHLRKGMALPSKEEDSLSESLPFQRQPVAHEPRVKKLIDLRKGTSTPLVNITKESHMTKDKMGTPTKRVDTNTASDSNTKNSKEHLECKLCQVKVISQFHLKEHCRGMKHLAKEKRASRLTTKPTSCNMDNPESLSKDDFVRECISGEKRKIEVLVEGNCEEKTSSASKKKKPRTCWECELCQVKATSEQSFKAHLNGKKHQAKERASKRISKPMICINEAPDQKLIKLEASTEKTSTDDSNKDVEAQNGDDSGKLKNEFSTGNKTSKFWCEMCRIGATSERSMERHLMGKKHFAKERASQRKNEPVSCNKEVPEKQTEHQASTEKKINTAEKKHR